MRHTRLLLISGAAALIFNLRGAEIDQAYTLGILQKITAVTPRHSGSPGARQTVLWLQQESELLGCRSSIQTFTAPTPHGPVSFYNLEAVRTGTDPKFVIIATHFDSKYLPDTPDFEGANDSASGVAGLLALMKSLQNVKLPLGVKFVFFDGEECFQTYGKQDGLQGSRHYARQMSQDDRDNCLAVIVIDMIGDPDLQLEIPPECDMELVQSWQSANRAAQIATVRSPQSILDDQVPFAASGLPALLLIDPGFGPGNSYWHTAKDRLGNTSAASICRVVQTLRQLLLAINQTE